MFRTAPHLIAVSLAVMTSLAPASAHEFWIAPEAGAIAAGAPITADLKVGQMLRGEPYPYLSNRFTRFTLIAGGETLPVLGSEGDLPAMAVFPSRPGLNVIAHQTVAFRVIYDDWAVFRKYLADEGLDRFAEVHRARGLPTNGFAERYTRYAKALVQAGPVKSDDGDVRIGLPLELIAGVNPYTPGLTALPVTLAWGGKPVAGQQINVFRDANGTVKRSAVVTDETGRALIPLESGGDYLLNAVHLESVDNAPVVWESHWASLTFSTGRGMP